jgi:lactate dehydrogenase-like 2-hydroxyacid dehydrogenase
VSCVHARADGGRERAATDRGGDASPVRRGDGAPSGLVVGSLQFGGDSPHDEVLGRTIGIIGYGRIGREVAEWAAGIKCRVLAANRC